MNTRTIMTRKYRRFALILVAASSLIGLLASAPSAAAQSSEAQPIPFSVVPINVAVNDLVFDPFQQKIYFALPSSAGPVFGNTIVGLDTQTGTVGPVALTGSEPNRLAISDDGLFLYVGLSGANSVQRFHLPDLKPDISFSLGSDSFLGPLFARDIQVMPGNSHSVAVARMYKNLSPSSAGIAIFDDGVERPNTTPFFAPFDSIQFGRNDSTLYAYNSETSGLDFYQVSVDSSGLTLGSHVGGLIAGFNSNIHFDWGTGLVYGDDGGAIDPVALTLIGTYSARGVMIPDSGVGRAFFVTSDFSTGDTQIQAFDQGRFTPLGAIDLGNVIPVASSAASFIRWGPTGLAFRTTGPTGQVFLLVSTLVLPPSSTPNPAPVATALLPSNASVGGPNLGMIVQGSNFALGSTVLWNGRVRTTRFLDSNYLLAWIPTTDLVSKGSARVSVFTPAPAGGTSAPLSFTIK
ncbi:MAG TPA: hypothetical protein VN461_03775 [Vicinamibacteria bacterium]|nr:hypothetical protein [Vicinamibacteria bacterium]